MTSARQLNGKLADHKFLFYGAGEAGIGIAELLVMAMEKTGLSHAEAKMKCWFVDSRGLITAER